MLEPEVFKPEAAPSTMPNCCSVPAEGFLVNNTWIRQPDEELVTISRANAFSKLRGSDIGSPASHDGATDVKGFRGRKSGSEVLNP